MMALSMLQRPCSELQSSLESGCMLPASRDMKPFLSNPEKAQTFAITTQLLHLRCMEPPGIQHKVVNVQHQDATELKIMTLSGFPVVSEVWISGASSACPSVRAADLSMRA